MQVIPKSPLEPRGLFLFQRYPTPGNAGGMPKGLFLVYSVPAGTPPPAAVHPERSLVMGYLDDAHEATMRRLSMIPTEQFDQPVVYALGDTRPVWRALVGMAGDSTQHTGQIAYLRGMFTGMGWRRRAGWY